MLSTISPAPRYSFYYEFIVGHQKAIHIKISALLLVNHVTSLTLILSLQERQLGNGSSVELAERTVLV